MSGTVIERIADYVGDFARREPSAETMERARQLVLDTLGVALAAVDEPEILKIRSALSRDSCGEATVFGTGERVSLEDAVFVNGSMTRALDYMDVYFDIDASHPSENIPLLMAYAEAENLSGRDFLKSVVLAYDLQGWFTEALECNPAGWHHVTTGGFVAPAALGYLAGLDRNKLIHAIAVCGASNATSLGTGPQTTMKAFAYPLVSRNAVLAVRLARSGCTGPVNAVENFVQLTGVRANLAMPIEPDRPRIFRTAIKPYPTEFLSHSAMEALAQLMREAPVDASDIVTIEVLTHKWTTWIARPVSYAPASREEADHSLPYCLAAMILDGEIGKQQFRNDRWLAADILELMPRIRVVADDGLERLYPVARPAVVTIIGKDGSRRSARVDHPLGDPQRPMSWQNLEEKFRSCVDGQFPQAATDAIVSHVQDIENISARSLAATMAGVQA